MMHDPDTAAWLQALPIGMPAAIDGVDIWLKTYPGGAELGAYVLRDFSEVDLQTMLTRGFQAAVQFDAGFCLSPDGKSLCLSEWLPGVSSWMEAAGPLEMLLNQVEALRESVDPVTNPMQERIEQRMRKRLEGGIK